MGSFVMWREEKGSWENWRAKVGQEVTSVWVSQGLLKAPESIEGGFFMAELPGRGQ